MAHVVVPTPLPEKGTESQDLFWAKRLRCGTFPESTGGKPPDSAGSCTGKSVTALRKTVIGTEAYLRLGIHVPYEYHNQI